MADKGGEAASSQTVDTSTAKSKPGSTKKPSHSRRKRPPKRLSQKPNDVYVNRSSQFAGQMSRCQKLFDQGFNEITIHGLGAAIHRAINLALQLKETSSFPIDVYSTTSTVELVDDMEPLNDDVDFQTQSRPNSAIHIRLSRLSPPSHASQSTPSHTSQSTPSHTSQSTPSHASQSTSDKASGKSSKTAVSKDSGSSTSGKGYSARTL